jgi:hypothetical protein
MGIAEAVIAFIVVGLPTIAIAVLVIRAMQYRERKLELEAQIAAAKAVDGDYARRLEERLRVLERIVTDQGHGVAHEIEQLRESRARPAALPASEQAEI